MFRPWALIWVPPPVFHNSFLVMNWKCVLDTNLCMQKFLFSARVINEPSKVSNTLPGGFFESSEMNKYTIVSSSTFVRCWQKRESLFHMIRNVCASEYGANVIKCKGLLCSSCCKTCYYIYGLTLLVSLCIYLCLSTFNAIKFC